MDYIDSIKLHHAFVSFSSVHNVFFISLWNGVLRDGKVDDIDIQFFEAKSPIIIDNFLSFDNKNIILSRPQLQHLSSLFSNSTHN
jgi:hypothetical protein